jgi:hypothetical protein
MASSFVGYEFGTSTTITPNAVRRPFCPSVKLSPKARYLVTLRVDALSVTENPHWARRERASVALHVTGVVPTVNDVPDAGAHATVTGAAPPTAVGVV